jgi:hypothetical protein
MWKWENSPDQFVLISNKKIVQIAREIEDAKDASIIEKG